MTADYFDALTGYREWRGLTDGFLAAHNTDAVWPPYQPMRAFCIQTGTPSAHMINGTWQDAPQLMCTCGIYALKAERDLVERIRTGGQPYWGGTEEVWGTVKLWGRVIEHAAGYRAEFAYPSELSTYGGTTLAAQIAALYGVPCHAIQRPKRLADDLSRYYYGLAAAPRIVIMPTEDIELKQQITAASPAQTAQYAPPTSQSSWQKRQTYRIQHQHLSDWRAILRGVAYKHET